MTKYGYKQTLCLLAAVSILTACRQQDFDNDEALPYGKYPLTLNSNVKVSAASRAGTVDGEWTADCQVAVRSGNEVKRYALLGGKNVLQVAEGLEPFYWTSANETKTVSAWCCGGGYQETLPGSWSVGNNQNIDGNYAASDLLYAPPCDISFAGHKDAVLTFYHQMTRVDINIVNTEAATSASYVRGVTVGNDNLALKASYTAPQEGATVGTWTGHSDSGTITPLEVEPSSSNFVKSYSAMVIPQNMTGKQFIAVALADGIAYYYTPAGNDAVLEGGKRYTYNITVHFGHIEVQLTEAVNWIDQPVESTTPEEVTAYKITPRGISIPEGADLIATDGDGNILSLSNGAYTTYDRAFNLSLIMPKGQFLDKFKLDGTAGTYTLTSQYTDDSGSTYTYRFSDITSDINLGTFTAEPATATPPEPKICDFYYLDGTWSTGLRDKPCIGVVFWTGDPTTQDPTLRADHPECTHGLVLAVDDASTFIKWQQNCVSVQSWLNEHCPGEFSNIEINYNNQENINVILGYNNTKAIEKYNSMVHEPDRVTVIDAVTGFRQKTPAPPGCSGWYLPSMKELTLAFGEDNVLEYNDNYLKNTMFEKLYNGPLAKLGVTISIERDAYWYWASTEYNNFLARCVVVYPEYKEYSPSDYKKNQENTFKSRCVLAF